MLKYRGKVSERAILYYHLIAQLGIFFCSDKAIFSYLRSNHGDDHLINWGWAVTKTDQTEALPIVWVLRTFGEVGLYVGRTKIWIEATIQYRER
jgi:hypothetical protein